MMPELPQEGERSLADSERENERERESEWESTAGSVRVEPPRSADSVTHDSTRFAFVYRQLRSRDRRDRSRSIFRRWTD